MKSNKKQLNLPEHEMTLSLMVGIDGERYLNLDRERVAFTEYEMDSSLPFWKRAICKLLYPSQTE